MIRDTTAQRIAAEWHSGQWSALYQLASTGAIDESLTIIHGNELTELARSCQGTGTRDFTDLIELRSYCRRHGPRPAVPDWYDRVIRIQE